VRHQALASLDYVTNDETVPPIDCCSGSDGLRPLLGATITNSNSVAPVY
jgi:hypothetical protein